MDLAAIKTLHDEKKIQLVDVREDDEHQEGYVTGAILAPLSKLTSFELLNSLPKNTPLYLYCASAKRAQIAKKLLAPHFPQVEAPPFGFNEFKEHGFCCKE